MALGIGQVPALGRIIVIGIAAKAPRAGGVARTDDAASLRVGFLSHEFGYNVVGRMLAALLPAFDPTRVHLVGLSYGRSDASIEFRRIRAACSEFYDLAAFDDAAAAQHIAGLDLDILVDINPIMSQGRPRIAAFRPAKAQVSYLCPLTSGAPWIDWFITDPIATPPSQAEHFSEALVWLPPSYLPSPGPQPLAPIPSRAALGLPERGLILASFNRQDKLLPETFALWLQLLHEFPTSVLWIAAPDAALSHLRRTCQDAAIDPARLIPAPYEPDMARHIARLAQADLFLDTFPHTAHVTAFDVLWAGLPLLTRTGETFASRVAASILQALELSELIAEDAADWLTRARQLLAPPTRLQALRQRLLASRHEAALWQPVIQARRLTRAFTMIREQIASRQCRSFHLPE